MPEDLNERLDRIEREIQEVREESKERESSVLRAVRTFFRDIAEFKRGARGFPESATLGLLNAYLRPRIVIFVGSLLGAVLAGLQFWLIYGQSQIMERQNEIMNVQTERMEEQTRVAEVQAVASMMSMIDPANPESTEIGIAQLAEHGDAGFDALLSLAGSSAGVATYARRTLFESGRQHDLDQFVKVLDIVGPTLSDSENWYRDCWSEDDGLWAYFSGIDVSSAVYAEAERATDREAADEILRGLETVFDVCTDGDIAEAYSSSSGRAVGEFAVLGAVHASAIVSRKLLGIQSLQRRRTDAALDPGPIPPGGRTACYVPEAGDIIRYRAARNTGLTEAERQRDSTAAFYFDTIQSDVQLSTVEYYAERGSGKALYMLVVRAPEREEYCEYILREVSPW